MKNTMRRLTIVAAALAAVAGSAVAQTFEAEIPLSFRVGDKLMVPGAYSISLSGMSSLSAARVYNGDTKQSVLLIGGPNASVERAWREHGKAVLVFECASNVCIPRYLWNGVADHAYRFSGPRPAAGELRTAVVALNPVKAD